MCADAAPRPLASRTRRPVPCTRPGCDKPALYQTYDVLEIETAHGHPVVVSLHTLAARIGLRLVPVDPAPPMGYTEAGG